MILGKSFLVSWEKSLTTRDLNFLSAVTVDDHKHTGRFDPDNESSRLPAMSAHPHAMSPCHIQKHINLCCHKSYCSFCGLFPPFFKFMWRCIVTKFLIIKPARCTNSLNLFWNETTHVSDSSYFHHQELFSLHSAMLYVIQVCRQLASRIRMQLQFHPGPARKLSTNLYDIYHCWVYRE
jgi:hypothetical protein